MLKRLLVFNLSGFARFAHDWFGMVMCASKHDIYRICPGAECTEEYHVLGYDTINNPSLDKWLRSVSHIDITNNGPISITYVDSDCYGNEPTFAGRDTHKRLLRRYWDSPLMKHRVSQSVVLDSKEFDRAVDKITHGKFQTMYCPDGILIVPISDDLDEMYSDDEFKVRLAEYLGIKKVKSFCLNDCCNPYDDRVRIIFE